MRNNQPVTQREYALSDEHLLITRTDHKGRITYVNNDFIEVSGFSREELIGSPHNIIRHPDMPEAAFADLWESVQRGDTWRGLVKNRRKDGDHYWVDATVTPIMEDGECQGYTSVRVKAEPEAIKQAERSYQALRDGKGGRYTLRRGRVVRRGLVGRLMRLNLGTIQAKLMLMTLTSLLLLAISGAVGLYGLQASGARVADLNRDGLQDVIRLQQMDQLINEGHQRVSGQERMAVLEARFQHAGAISDIVVSLERLWGEYQAREINHTALAAEFDGQLQAYIGEGLTPMAEVLSGEESFDAMMALNNRTQGLREQGSALSTSINGLIEEERLAALGMAEAAERGQRQMLIGQSSFMALALVLLLLLGLWITAAITRPLRQAVSATLQIGSGNLAARVPDMKQGELGQLMSAMRVMRHSLYTTTWTIKQSVDIVTPATGAIAKGNEDLSARTEQQAASLQETASSMEQMTTTVQQNTDNARQASGLALDNANRVRETGELMQDVVQSMERITASSRKMTDIINTIDAIAFQTNILALNASVEAARAGEQGRGFAVVAGEVRNLAGRSADAAKEIRGLIATSNGEIEGGAAQVQQAEGAMSEVVAASQRVNDIMGEITAASEEQSGGIGQITQAITEMDQVTQQNAARVEETASAAAELKQQAERLAREIGVYRLRGAGPETAETRGERRSADEHSAALPRQHDPLPAKRAGVTSRKAAATQSVAEEAEWETF
ncbi:PAS domain-containing protein [Halomonas campisalis]|uniref:PAS domain-containing protein n=1 Tax=Billgrantia campisalis TaxID=74661 RepID=A0ABS9P354_9GAMM|nr:PAS domain-containing methyl-accepting chemotaxis protein [Halomonas campisalis]MCG6656209.1 PAS domain-containing protein [Halomonas campisalis]MDR5861395.1 methyl-accepting chemotaxis protein [Halomonas campisalis]